MLGNQKRPFYIDAEQSLKVTQFCLFHPSDQADSRIIDENIQPVDTRKCGFYRALVRDIAFDRRAVRKLGCQRLRLGFVDVGDDDGCASFGENAADRFSDSAGAAGDKRTLAVKTKRHDYDYRLLRTYVAVTHVFAKRSQNSGTTPAIV